MFLDRIGQLGLLSHQEDTNIIAPLPLIVRKKMIWEAVQCLTQRSVTLNYTQTLTSFTHVKWYMELLGHGFNLPIEDVVIVNECINVFKTWLLEGGDPLMVPPGSRGYEQIFWQKIFMHASLLFQPRKSYDSSPISNSQQPATQEILTSEALVNTHVTLCRHILLMILTSAQQQTTSCAAQTTSNSNPASTQQQTYHLDFSRDTWIVLLKVLLGCADRLLTEPTLVLKSRRGSYIESSVNSASLNTGTPVSEKPILSRWGRSGAAGNADRASVGDVNPGPTMGDALCDFLSKVLIEVWLRSEEMDVGLWTCLKDQYEKWTHRVEIVRNWSAVTLALSNRVIQLLYGDKEGTKYTTVSFPSSPTFNLDLSEKFTVYAWHKFTYIIGNINAIEAPENFYVAVKGISRVVDSFLLVGTRREFHPEITAPDGNTLLHMFGPWLFEAVTRKSPEYEDGISEAFGILCKIICSPQPRTKFLPTYLSRIYSCISIALRTGHPQTLTSIMMGCENFFLMDLEGSRVLVHDFAVGLKRILPSVDKTGFPVGIVTMEELRKGCLKIIGGILGVLNVFENVGIKSLVVLERSDFGDKIRACYPSYDQYASIRPSNNRDNDSDHPMPSSQNTVALKNLKPYLLDLLLNTLHVEQSATNTKHVLHLLSCFSVEEIDFCPASVSLVLGTVKEKILSKVWPQDVQSCAFDVLTQLTFFWEAIDKASKGSCKDVVVSLCNYIDGLFAEDNVVANQHNIIRGYDCLLRWVLIGNWVEQEKECLAKVNATLCRGVSVLARDDEFSVVGGSNNNSNNHHHTTQTHNPTSSRPGSNYGSNGNLLATGHHTPSPLSPNFSAGLASGASSITSGTEKTTLANHFAAFAGNVSSMTTDTLRKHRGKQKRSATLLNPLSTLVAAVTINQQAATGPNNNSNNSTPTLHTIPTNNPSSSPQPPNNNNKPDVGVSTFAKLTADSAVKSAAEIALNQLLLHLGNFPARRSSFGVTRISTLFQEQKELARILMIRERLLQNSIFASSRNSVGSEAGLRDSTAEDGGFGGGGVSGGTSGGSWTSGAAPEATNAFPSPQSIQLYPKYIRYFVYDNRILMGLLEQPEWARESGRGCSIDSDDDDGVGGSKGQVDSELDFTLQPPRDPKLILIVRDSTGKFSWVLRYKYVEDSKRVEAYQEMQRQQFGGASFGDSRSSSKADQEGKGSTGEGGENNNGAVGESLSPPPPERPLRPKSAPLLGGHVRKPPSPVKLKEQQLLPHETEGNIAEAFQAERKSQTQLEALNNGASARTSAAYMESNNNFPSNTDNGGEYHVRPKLPPYIPPNSDVLRGECFNESAIPKFSELLNPDTEEGRRFELLKKKLDRCIEIEKATYNSADDDRLCVDTAVRPTPPIDRFDVNVPCAVFRQFLSHMGYINLDTREKLKPMVMSEAFLKDLEKMDALPERECFGVSVLYAKNCTTTIEEMIHPKSTTPDFYEFLHSIGSPVALDRHVGYRGNLSAQFCKTTSYFATRNVEMLFITPYTMKAPENEALKTVYMNSISENIVTILWIENLVDIDNVVKRVTSNITLNASTVIVIHPKSLAASNALYNVRLMTAAGSIEDNPAIGPLVDGMVVNKRALGNLVRMTSQSGHLVARVMKPGYRRPQTARRLMIEEICGRHKLASSSMAAFYSDLFS